MNIISSVIDFLQSFLDKFKRNSTAASQQPIVIEVEKKKIKIKDVIRILPWHPVRIWGKRNTDDIEYIVIHQSAHNPINKQNWLDTDEINQYHITPSEQNHLSKKGAPHIAYHFVIERDGTVKQCNLINAKTWHVKYYNDKAVGILLIGNFSGPGWAGTEYPTEAQGDSLVALLDVVIDILPGRQIVGHCDLDTVNRPADPGFIVTEWLKIYKQRNV